MGVIRGLDLGPFKGFGFGNIQRVSSGTSNGIWDYSKG